MRVADDGTWLRVVGVGREEHPESWRIGGTRRVRLSLGHGRVRRIADPTWINCHRISDLASLHGDCRCTERPVTGMGMDAKEPVQEFRLFPGINKATDPPLYTNSSSSRQLPAYLIRRHSSFPRPPRPPPPQRLLRPTVLLDHVSFPRPASSVVYAPRCPLYSSASTAATNTNVLPTSQRP